MRAAYRAIGADNPTEMGDGLCFITVQNAVRCFSGVAVFLLLGEGDGYSLLPSAVR